MAQPQPDKHLIPFASVVTLELVNNIQNYRTGETSMKTVTILHFLEVNRTLKSHVGDIL